MEVGAMDFSQAKTAPLQEVLRLLSADPEQGLSSEQVKSRQAQFGYNEIPEKEISPLLKFLTYLWGERFPG